MIRFGFTSRDNGDMRNTKRLIDYLHARYHGVKTIVRPVQVHGDTIAVYEGSPHKDDPTHVIYDTDGVITRKKDVALTIITADCIPIIFTDEVYQMIGASHQGWRGILARLPQKMVAKMEELGSKKADIRVVIGPGINSCCYEVKEERAIQFRSEFPLSKAIINNGNHFFLNLTQLVNEELVEVGISEPNITRSIACTSCQTDKFYSYRKAKNKADYEEQASYILLS